MIAVRRLLPWVALGLGTSAAFHLGAGLTNAARAAACFAIVALLLAWLDDEVWHRCADCGARPSLRSLYYRAMGEGVVLEAHGGRWLCVNCYSVRAAAESEQSQC